MTGTATRQMALLNLLSGGECLTTDELAQGVPYDHRKVATACGQLVTRGLIERKERGCFLITAEGLRSQESGVVLTSGPQGPLTQRHPRTNRKQTKRDLIWRAIRIAQKFSLAEIETLAEASHDNAAGFVWALEKAGYLMPIRREPGTAPTSNGFKRWLLFKDPGPQTPVYRPRRGEVFDPNSGETIKVRS